ncbi:uncharacterized protein METZ01_LOCUS227673, partial [marine metagenome]
VHRDGHEQMWSMGVGQGHCLDECVQTKAGDHCKRHRFPCVMNMPVLNASREIFQ